MISFGLLWLCYDVPVPYSLCEICLRVIYFFFGSPLCVWVISLDLISAWFFPLIHKPLDFNMRWISCQCFSGVHLMLCFYARSLVCLLLILNGYSYPQGEECWLALLLLFHMGTESMLGMIECFHGVNFLRSRNLLYIKGSWGFFFFFFEHGKLSIQTLGKGEWGVMVLRLFSPPVNYGCRQ